MKIQQKKMLVVVLKKKKHCKAHLEITQQPFDLIEHCMLSYTKRACTAVVGTHCRTGRVHHSFFLVPGVFISIKSHYYHRGFGKCNVFPQFCGLSF